MQFCALLRAVGADTGNLKFELDLFHGMDVDNTGKLDEAEFVDGFLAYLASHESADFVKSLVVGVRAYEKRGTVEL